MRILVCGGDDFSDRQKLFYWMDYLRRRDGTTEIVLLRDRGRERGAQLRAKAWAAARRVRVSEVEVQEDEFRRLGPGARTIRNRKAFSKHRPAKVVAFAGGEETAEVLREAREHGVLCAEVV